MLFANVICRVL